MDRGTVPGATGRDNMKKRMKKLELNRETLRALEECQIQEVVGASGGGPFPASFCLTGCCSYDTCNTKYC